MMIEKKNAKGNVSISMEAIAAIAGNAATECYGVVGMVPKTGLRASISELLRIENYKKGVFAKESKTGIEVEMYIMVAYGLKITEVVNEVQKKVKYVLEKTLDIKFKSINVFVKGIKSV